MRFCKLTLCIIVFASSVVFADTWKTDAKVGLLGRSYPIGAQFNGTWGVSAPLWGDTHAWKYGYVRGALNAATSAVVNRLGVEFQVFPVSILGFSAGFESTLRSFRAPFVSCVDYQCFGRVNRQFLKLTSYVGAKGVILNYNVRYERLSSPGSARPFYDEMTLIPGNSGGESVLTLNPVLLYTVHPGLRVGGISVYVRGETSGSYSHLYGPVVSMNPYSPKVNAVVGAGLNESSLVHSALTIFFMFQYTFDSSMAVTDIALREQGYSSLF